MELYSQPSHIADNSKYFMSFSISDKLLRSLPRVKLIAGAGAFLGASDAHAL